MPIDPSIALQARGVQLEDPLAKFGNFLQAQQLQNQNALAPLQYQQMLMANKQKQQQFDMIAPILARMSGQQPQEGQPMNALAGGGQPAQGTGQFNALAGGNPNGIPTSDGIPYSLSDLGALSAAGYPGAKEMLEVKKAAMQGVGFDPGKTYNVGGKVFTVPQLDKGMQMGANGVEPIPGYSATNAGIQGAQASATEGAKPLPLGYVGQDGRPIGGTVSQYLGQPAPGLPQTPAQGAQGPQGLDLSKLNPQQIAGLARTDPAAFANGTKDFQQTSASNYTPPAVGADGAPLPPQTQQVLSQLAQTRDPGKLQQFAQAMNQHILQNIPAGPQQQAALLNVQTEAAKIQQSWQAPQAPAPAASPNGMPVLQSATEAGQAAAAVELQKQQGLDQLKLQNAPAQGYANKAAEALQVKAEHVGAQLSESQNLLQRISESRAAMQKFQAGGGMDTKVEMAKIAQSLHMPDFIVNGLAGGNLAAAQEFQKYAAQEAIGTMRQALASDDGKGSPGNKIAMTMFFKNNPNVDTDPNATEKIFNFLTKQHNELLDKSDMLSKFVSDPSTVKDPIVFDNLYAKHQLATGNVKAQMIQGQAKGTTPAQSQAAPAGWVLHSDAKGNKAYVSPDGKQFQEVK